MKRILAALAAFLLLIPSFAAAEGDLGALFEQGSDVMSPALARFALGVSSRHTAELTEKAFEENGLSVLLQRYYDKPLDEVSHTAAFTIGKAEAEVGGVKREICIIAVRGTNGAEWYSNFDFAPSESNETLFAENFLFAAQDIYLAAAPEIAKMDNPIILVCGHSRGAACANLLGVLLSSAYPAENVFAYTFATPATVRGDFDWDAYKNIFNFLNPCDLVPLLPLSQWGYKRAGTDYVLAGDAEAAKRLEDSVSSLYTLAPTINEYYTSRHSLTEAGLSDDGLTAYEMMLLVSDVLSKVEFEDNESVSDFSLFTGSDSMSVTGSASETSDFHTLLTLLESLTENGGEIGKRVTNAHMPETYMELLSAL